MKITSTNKCIWVVDTIRQHKALTLKDLNTLWLATKHSHGKPISRAGFYCLRKAALDLFGVTISTNLSTFEYYIEEDPKYYRNTSVTDWLVNTSILNDTLMSAGEVASRIELEYVPSAREYLKPIIQALQENKLISIDYQPFTKSVPTTDIKLAPYFLKIFKQRWYVIGKDMKEQKVKTYALDRIVRLELTDLNFNPDPSLVPEKYFRDLFGIESNKTEAVEVQIKAVERDAKYLRALPLHHSQKELIDVGYSIFVYKLKITNDLVRELLSMGKGIEVMKPKELREMMEDTLKTMLSNYGYTCIPPEKKEEPQTNSIDNLPIIESNEDIEAAVAESRAVVEEVDESSKKRSGRGRSSQRKKAKEIEAAFYQIKDPNEVKMVIGETEISEPTEDTKGKRRSRKSKVGK